MKNLAKAAPPIELIVKGGDPEKISLYACGSCRLSTKTREEAISCCAPYVCETCGAEVKSYCEPCSKKEQAKKSQAVYDKAKKVTYKEYDGQMLFCDHCDEYFWDLDTFLDAHNDVDDEDFPTWAWGTYQVDFALNANDVICGALESQEFYDDADQNIEKESVKEMQEFFDAWCERNPLNSYSQDMSVVVDLEEYVDAVIKERNEADAKYETREAEKKTQDPG
jgi:hypothetical protein